VALPHLPVYLLGGVAAGVAAFLSVAFLMRYFRVGRLDPFAYYCAAFGIVSLILLSR
jgi:undecaprenyl pyrophosphate phosphatase UppP